MEKIIFIIALFVGSFSFAQELEMEELNELEEDTLGGYYINSKSVNETKFYDFLETLKPLKGTWYCDDMDDGGQTGYDAEDAKGNVYSYYCLSHPRDSHCAIELQKP